MPGLKSKPWLLLVAVAAMGAGVAFQAAHALFGVGGRGWDSFTKDGVYTAVELIAVGVCAARVVSRRADRWVWSLMTFGLLSWTAGDLVWTVWLNDLANPPTPSLADALYLPMYPAMYVALMLLIRSGRRRGGAAQWLDGGVVGLTLAAIGAALILPSVLALSHGRVIEDAVNLAYPLGDLTLLAFVVVAFSLSGWRPSVLWVLLGLALAIDAAGDLIYVYEAARGTYLAGGILDTTWPAAMSLLALAAWQSSSRQIADPILAPRTIAVPLIAAALSLALLVDGAFHRVTAIAVVLAAGALLLTTLRASLTYVENVRMLRRSAQEAITDGLSGLGNRRRLMQDLADAVADANARHPTTLVFFDLNGFKRYNDTFGHAAGDSLLARLGAALSAAVEGNGGAYRLGGDEFCALLAGRLAREHTLVTHAAAALSERGSGFAINASFGLAVVPDDERTASAALRLADQRMYADKARTSDNGRPRTRDVLMQLLTERSPELHEHLEGVGQLARELGRHFALDSEQLDELLRAAELHDVGKLAVPDQILNKPGPLDDSEWEFIRQHPIIGERILNIDPALRPVARLVRASHERWDGNGYPDRLAGPAIPLGARIIAACDAYHAITTDRCYQAARTITEAIAELQRNAGSQFDPEVIDALCTQLSTHTTR
jgi:two-component system, cell cycle response regulator